VRELALYCMQFPTVPAWFAQLEAADIVLRPPGSFPCMADAEDGEQPGFDKLPPPGELLGDEECQGRGEVAAAV
jgi:hypothetical protein